MNVGKNSLFSLSQKKCWFVVFFQEWKSSKINFLRQNFCECNFLLHKCKSKTRSRFSLSFSTSLSYRKYFFFLQCLPKFFKICCQNIDLLSLFSEPEVVNLTKYLVVLHQKTSYYLYWNYERRKIWFPEYFFLK